MDPIRSIMAPPVGDAPRLPARPSGPAGGRRSGLDPAVSVKLREGAAPDAPEADTATAEPERRGFERDAETQAIVFRISDALTGDVVVQIPDEVVIRARAYARQPPPAPGGRVARSA